MVTIEALEPLSIGLAAPAERVAHLAHKALLDELETWPKPGLVSYVDAGSHDDMNAGTFERSAAAISPYFAALARAGERRADMPELRRIGLAAEAAMMAATDGVNAHRGAVFGLGLLCAAEGARGYASGPAEELVHTVRSLWGEAILRIPAASSTHGGAATLRFGVGGARGEAGAGFPAVLRIGLPALRAGLAVGHGLQAARVHCFFALLAEVDDTNLLHRGGREGLIYAQDAASRFMAAGGVAAPDWIDRAVAVHRAFVERRLSPGGVADLLSATLFVDALAAPC